MCSTKFFIFIFNEPKLSIRLISVVMGRKQIPNRGSQLLLALAANPLFQIWLLLTPKKNKMATAKMQTWGHKPMGDITDATLYSLWIGHLQKHNTI